MNLRVDIFHHVGNGDHDQILEALRMVKLEVQLLKGTIMALSDDLKAAAANIVARADHIEEVLAAVRAQLADLIASNSVSNATVQEVIATLDAEAADLATQADATG